MDLMIVHDWDNEYLSGTYALSRGIKLIIYSLSRRIGLLRRLNFVKEIENELTVYCESLLRLNELLNIKSYLCFNTDQLKDYDNKIEMFNKYYGLCTPKYHKHINKIPYWFNIEDGKQFLIEVNTFWFDKEYHKGLINYKGEKACFHIDYPYYIFDYIKFLHENRRLIKNGN